MSSISVIGIYSGRSAPLSGHPGTLSAINKRLLGQMRLVERDGIAGDMQTDKRHHGGPERALHHYAKEHYKDWAKIITDFMHKPAPRFGENILTLGITEQQVSIGDIFKLGTCTVQVSQPRTPCGKLNQFLNHDTVHKHIFSSAKCGWFYRVLVEGAVWNGASLELLEKDKNNLSVYTVFKMIYDEIPDMEMLEKIAGHEALSDNWREKARSRLQNLKPGNSKQSTILNPN